MARARVSNAISPLLFMHLQQLYKAGIKPLKANEIHRRVGLNGHHEYALSSYPIAVAAWEAFLNETCMSTVAELDYPNSLLWDMREQAEKWEITTKTLLIPKLLLGTTFDKATQPYQDFQQLVSIRNHIVHFKIEEAPMKVLKDLSQRRITLTPPPNTELSWSLQLMSTECIRWAINTIAKMVQELSSWFPYKPGQSMVFKAISEEAAKEMFGAESLDPNTEYNPPEFDIR